MSIPFPFPNHPLLPAFAAGQDDLFDSPSLYLSAFLHGLSMLCLPVYATSCRFVKVCVILSLVSCKALELTICCHLPVNASLIFLRSRTDSEKRRIRKRKNRRIAFQFPQAVHPDACQKCRSQSGHETHWDRCQYLLPKYRITRNSAIQKLAKSNKLRESELFFCLSGLISHPAFFICKLLLLTPLSK